ncbi:histone deacetylase family protein [Pyrococcus kukulkanii]|uniref:Histone deacetylase domain-containing protein n=1 Tax=Pyrococcus kukulkanii TaxID=1609559 RepID=A0A127BC51_9EURY|nr:histone deacetylase family protein [Pyrococcus kukulkanii]AMM54911.1 hypothetical protein TQ32_10765 [Pyrococcus kukulkanii]
MIGEIYYSRKFLQHKPENYHPENPGRLWVLMSAIRELMLDDRILEPTPVDENFVKKIHNPAYVEFVKRAIREGRRYLDPDTYISPGTWDAALMALGASRLSALAALRYGGLNMALVRPPGHHAGKRGKAMGAPTLGFCIFNNMAAGVLALREEGIKKILVIDFDAHHGNGTQEIFWYDPDVIHIDLHERDIYPWTGYETEIGGGLAKGSKVNIPMPHYSNDADYIFAWNEIVLAVVENVNPKIILLSAGFDGFKGDGLTTLKLTEKFFSYAGASLRKYSIAFIFEGGYDVGLKKGFPAFVKGYEEIEVNDNGQPSYETLKVVEEIKDILSPWWSF